MAVWQKPIKYALGIDWETSGLDPDGFAKTRQGIAFGAIVVDMDTLDELEVLYREIKFDPKYVWDAGAEKVHGLTREYLDLNGVSQEDAACDLGEMIVKYWGPNPTVLMLGHNTAFDIAYTRQLLEPFDLMPALDYTVLDTAGIGFAMLGIHKSEKLFQALGLPERTQHNALEDIMYTVESLRVMRACVQLGKEVFDGE